MYLFVTVADRASSCAGRRKQGVQPFCCKSTPTMNGESELCLSTVLANLKLCITLPCCVCNHLAFHPTIAFWMTEAMHSYRKALFSKQGFASSSHPLTLRGIFTRHACTFSYTDQINVGVWKSSNGGVGHRCLCRIH